nr:MAG TPA: hypothetical protein [Caudoviricetes sp.]
MICCVGSIFDSQRSFYFFFNNHDFILLFSLLIAE